MLFYGLIVIHSAGAEVSIERPETIAAQAAGAMDNATGAIVPAIHITTTFERAPDNSYPKGQIYGRSDNATTRQAEEVINRLEGGARTLLFGSGMAASTALILALRRAGSEPTHQWCRGAPPVLQ